MNDKFKFINFDINKLETEEECRQLMENALRLGNNEVYQAALERCCAIERKNTGLRMPASILRVIRNAREPLYTTYVEPSEASGVDYSFYALINKHGHLQKMLEVCDDRKIPLLSALIVNQKNRETGDLEPEALKGFIDGVRALRRYTVTDENAFLRDCQQKAFAWVKTPEADDFVTELEALEDLTQPPSPRRRK